MSEDSLALYELAFSLGMPVYKLTEEMPYEEMLGWLYYFEKRPVGWRSDIRAAYLMKSQGVKAKITDIFPSLKNITENQAEKDPMESFKHSFLNSRLKKAVGGEKLEFL